MHEELLNWIYVWLQRAHEGDGAPPPPLLPPGAAGAQAPTALPSLCTHNPEDHEGMTKERERASHARNNPNSGDYGHISQTLQ